MDILAEIKKMTEASAELKKENEALKQQLLEKPAGMPAEFSELRNKLDLIFSSVSTAMLNATTALKSFCLRFEAGAVKNGGAVTPTTAVTATPTAEGIGPGKTEKPKSDKIDISYMKHSVQIRKAFERLLLKEAIAELETKKASKDKGALVLTYDAAETVLRRCVLPPYIMTKTLTGAVRIRNAMANIKDWFVKIGVCEPGYHGRFVFDMRRLRKMRKTLHKLPPLQPRLPSEASAEKPEIGKKRRGLRPVKRTGVKMLECYDPRMAKNRDSKRNFDRDDIVSALCHAVLTRPSDATALTATELMELIFERGIDGKFPNDRDKSKYANGRTRLQHDVDKTISLLKSRGLLDMSAPRGTLVPTQKLWDILGVETNPELSPAA